MLRSIAPFLLLAALACSHAEPEPDPAPQLDPRVATVIEAMEQQAATLEQNGHPEQAALTRRLAQQMRAGAFSDPASAQAAAMQLAAQSAAARQKAAPAPATAPAQTISGEAPAGTLRAGGALPPGKIARALQGKLAVLELRSFAPELSAQNARYFTDLVRQETLREEPQLEVMTRENLLVLLQATGKDLSNCEGECEVDTGRRIGADLIVSGEIQKIGTRYKLSLRLHETKEGRLLGSAIGSGETIDQLDDRSAQAARELFAQ